jgi:hypothetical protein
MKKLHLIIFTLVVITVMSCLNESTGDECGNDFFPLIIGDKFLYRLSPESAGWGTLMPEEVEVRVTHRVDTLGKTYSVIEDYFLVSGGSKGIIYARTEGSSSPNGLQFNYTGTNSVVPNVVNNK